MHQAKHIGKNRMAGTTKTYKPSRHVDTKGSVVEYYIPPSRYYLESLFPPPLGPFSTVLASPFLGLFCLPCFTLFDCFTGADREQCGVHTLARLPRSALCRLQCNSKPPYSVPRVSEQRGESIFEDKAK